MQEVNLYLLVIPELKEIYEKRTEKTINMDTRNLIL